MCALLHWFSMCALLHWFSICVHVLHLNVCLLVDLVKVSKANIIVVFLFCFLFHYVPTYASIRAVSQSRDYKSGTLFRPPSKMCELSDASKDTYRHSLAPSSSAKYLLPSSADFKRMLCLCVFVAVFVLKNLHHTILGKK